MFVCCLLSAAAVARCFLYHMYTVSGSTISTLLHGKINLKDWQVLSQGDAGFLQLFRVVSSDYGNPVFIQKNIFRPLVLSNSLHVSLNFVYHFFCRVPKRCLVGMWMVCRYGNFYPFPSEMVMESILTYNLNRSVSWSLERILEHSKPRIVFTRCNEPRIVKHSSSFCRPGPLSLFFLRNHAKVDSRINLDISSPVSLVLVPQWVLSIKHLSHMIFPCLCRHCDFWWKPPPKS